jgi:hypothetical protein
MSLPITVTFSMPNGVIVERKLQAQWTKELAVNLSELRGIDTELELKSIMSDLLQQAFDRKFISGILDELITKSVSLDELITKSVSK